MPTYIHSLTGWPNFTWDSDTIAEVLASVRHNQGRLLGRMEALGLDLRANASLQALTEDVLRSSEIEGEILAKDQVRSSLARRLNLDIGALATVDRDVEGVVEMMLDATQRFDAPLTEERLFDWHAALFPTARNGMGKIIVGAWRDDKGGLMQVVSGAIGREKVHFEAVPAIRLGSEMTAFMDWFNGDIALDPVMKAAIAHLWFVTIHPFDDGNGRIARAIADMALARSEATSQRYYSMSAQIRNERRGYYATLESTQKGSMDITGWLQWFLDCLDRAFSASTDTLSGVLLKARFWEAVDGQELNERQRKVVNLLLDGALGTEKTLTSSKWAKLTKTSPDTALRDINDLVRRSILTKDEAGGRSTSYTLVVPEE